MVVAQEQWRRCPADPPSATPAPALQNGFRNLRHMVDEGCTRGEEKQLIEIRHDLSPSDPGGC
jgi:hypothetical protein